MILNDVKKIAIPEGEVTKITDSSGNVIWIKPSTSLYRRLEYIHFNGAEYIQTDIYAGTPGHNFICEFTVEDTPTDTLSARTLLGVYDTSVSDTLRRFYLAWRGPNGIRASIGNVWSNYATDFSLNDKLKVNMTYNKNGSYPRGYWQLSNITTDTSIGSANPLAVTAVGDLNTEAYLKLGCQVSSNGNASNFWLGKIYSFQRRQGNSSGTLTHNYIPCQRKSDNVCGIYDTINNTFIPMTGTTITSDAAGPVVDEDWNLQA